MAKTKKKVITYIIRQVDLEIRADMASDSDCHHLAPWTLLLSSLASFQLDLLGNFSWKHIFVLSMCKVFVIRFCHISLSLLLEFH